MTDILGSESVNRMKKHLPLFALLLCICGGLRAQTFNLQTGREPIVSLNGLWRFHTGDNPAWASPNFDDSKWPLLRSDRPWTEQGYPGYGGYAWYRFTIQYPDGSKPFSLLLAPILSGYQVYANGELIGSAGSATPTRLPVLSTSAEIFRLPTGSAGPRTIQIALRIWACQSTASWFGGGPLGLGSVVEAPVPAARRLQLYRDADARKYGSSYAFCVLATLVGLTILVLFLFGREDREYLWFSVLLLAFAADAALSLTRSRSSIPFALDSLQHEIAVGISVIAAMGFFSIILQVRRAYLWWIACAAVIASPLSVVLFYLQWTGVAISFALWIGCLLPAYLWIIFELLIAVLRKNTSARLLLGPVLLLYGYRVLDGVVATTWQLGWQRKLRLLDTPFLQRPFPLNLEDVINYIFVLALLIFLVRRFSLARQEETRLSTEMEAARTVQSMLVPVVPPNTPGFAVESVYLPASEVGGDFFHVQPDHDGSLLIIVGDVSGKGLKAAMTVSTIVGALRNEPSRQPAQVLANLNRVLHGQIKGFVTCCACLLSADGAMTVANAGHIPPYRNGKEMGIEGDVPLGILPDAAYLESQFMLAPGDRLTFLSDGVVEATNEKRELFGFERTEGISTRSAQAIADEARNFGQQDDISVLTVRVLASVMA